MSLDPKDAPTCPKCKVITIVADAGVVKSIPYWFCPKCKNEVLTNYKLAPTHSDEEDPFFEFVPFDSSLSLLNWDDMVSTDQDEDLF